MSNSQNTKNEQQKDLCITSEQLTEQWKNQKLRLPIGDYYVLHISWCKEITKLYYDGGMFFSGDVPIESNEIKEVLAPVPTFEEWKAKLEENKRLKHDVGNLGYKIKNQRHEIDNRLKEIDKLKELLKECEKSFQELSIGYKYGIAGEIADEMLQKIDEVLK